MTFTRRHFLQTTAAGAAAGALAGSPLTAASRRRLLGSNEDLRVAVVGVRSRGRAHIGGFDRLPGVRVVALCDADRAILDREVQRLADDDVRVDGYVDLRKLLERDDIDVVSIATPNHLHSLQAIWAIQAGKDVYCEKPVSHHVWEGAQLVAAAAAHDRIVASGTQSRSSIGLHQAMAWLREGNIGTIEIARGLCYKPRGSIGKVKGPQEVPASVDYDLWCGPAPKAPLMRKNLHYDWHWVWPTGNGDLGNQGIHQMDLCRWALGESDLAPSVFSIGGRVGYDDDGTTPNTMFTVLGYEKAPLIFEVRGLPEEKGSRQMPKYEGARIGCVIHCTEGHMVIDSYSSATAFGPDGEKLVRFQGGGDHFANFVEAVRARDAKLLNADIHEGHVSSALCHMGNISVLRGETCSPDEVEERVAGDAATAETWERMAEHLARNEVDLEKTPIHVGPKLAFDVKAGHFEDPAARAMERREDRAPFVVPEIS